MGSVGGLEGLKELMVGHMLVELGGDCSFQDFAEERKVGDWPIVVRVVGVQTRLFEDRSDRGGFETGGYRSGSEGKIDDVNHEGAYCWQAGFDQRGGQGILGAGGGLGLGDQFGDEGSINRGEGGEAPLGRAHCGGRRNQRLGWMRMRARP